jgi:CheY-like chemotaxis protein
MSRLVDDLLDVSRITSGKVELQREPTELADVVARAVSMTAPLIEQRRHALRVNVPAGIVLELDGDRFTQIIGNLLTNAAKYTPPGSAIAIAARVRADAVELTVSDDGPGIPAELQPHVFEPFVQGARSADRQHGGLGLGLPIVQRLVELHGGQIALASTSAGTAVTISMPPSAAKLAARRRSDSEPTERDARGTILVVDDNEDAAVMLAEALHTAGYEVHVATDGPSALRSAIEHAPQLAILDIGLPHMDGYELSSALRQLPGLGSLMLLAVTGYNGPSEREQARRAGFVEHFTKPVNLSALLAALKRLLESSRN